MVSALTSSRVVTSKCIMGFEATDCHRWEISGFYSWRRVFSSVNYNNVYCAWITTQYLRQIKENSKLSNGGFKKWLKILAGKDLQTKLRKREKVDFKFSASNGTDVYKSGTGTSGRGHWDACVGTWDLGTRDEGLEDIKYGTRGRQKQGRRYPGCQRFFMRGFRFRSSAEKWPAHNWNSSDFPSGRSARPPVLIPLLVPHLFPPKPWNVPVTSTIALSKSSVRLSEREAKIKNQAEFLCSTSLLNR